MDDTNNAREKRPEAISELGPTNDGDSFMSASETVIGPAVIDPAVTGPPLTDPPRSSTLILVSVVAHVLATFTSTTTAASPIDAAEPAPVNGAGDCTGQNDYVSPWASRLRPSIFPKS